MLKHLQCHENRIELISFAAALQTSRKANLSSASAMFPHLCSVVCFLLSIFFAITVTGLPWPCQQRMKDAKLVPKYIDEKTKGDLQVVYEEKYPVKCGSGMSFTKTFHSPTVTYDLHGKCKNASIIMFDPDVPIPVFELNLFLHWFVLNIPADVLKKGYSTKQGGLIGAPYFPLLAPTGNHRYTFCIYCQQKQVRHVKRRNTIPERLGVNPKDLAREYHLGNPLSCNFLYLVLAELDLEGVPLADANKKLGNMDETIL